MKNLHPRVPFTYNSFLYKLDNIHLKQTYRGKPYNRTPEANYNKQKIHESHESSCDPEEGEYGNRKNYETFEVSREVDQITHDINYCNDGSTQLHAYRNVSTASTTECVSGGISSDISSQNSVNTKLIWNGNNSESDDSVGSDLSIDGGLKLSVDNSAMIQEDAENPSKGIFQGSSISFDPVKVLPVQIREQNNDCDESDERDKSFDRKEQVDRKVEHSDSGKNLSHFCDPGINNALSSGKNSVKSVERETNGSKEKEKCFYLDDDEGDSDRRLGKQNMNCNTLDDKKVSSLFSRCQTTHFEFDKPNDDEKLKTRYRSLNKLDNSSKTHHSKMFVKVYENTSNLQDVFSSLLGTTRSRSFSAGQEKSRKGPVLEKGNVLTNSTNSTLNGQSEVHWHGKQVTISSDYESLVSQLNTGTSLQSATLRKTDTSLSMVNGELQYLEKESAQKTDSNNQLSTNPFDKKGIFEDDSYKDSLKKQSNLSRTPITQIEVKTQISKRNIHERLEVENTVVSGLQIHIEEISEQRKHPPCAFTLETSSSSVQSSSNKALKEEIVPRRSKESTEDELSISFLEIEKDSADLEKEDDMCRISDDQSSIPSPNHLNIYKSKEKIPVIGSFCSGVTNKSDQINLKIKQQLNIVEELEEEKHEVQLRKTSKTDINDNGQECISKKFQMSEKAKADKTHIITETFDDNGKNVHGKNQKVREKQKEILMRTSMSIEADSNFVGDKLSENKMESEGIQPYEMEKTNAISDLNEQDIKETQSYKNDCKVDVKAANSTSPPPIIVKRMYRPEGKTKKGSKEADDTSSDLPFDVRMYPQKIGEDFEEDYMFSQKMMAERLANLPIITGHDTKLICPTCGEQVFNTGKPETSCIDPLHKMLLKIPSLQTVAEQYGLVVHSIAGDGNCMFSAVIDQLRIAGDFSFTTHTLRSAAVEYLHRNPTQEDGSHLMCFLSNESWEDYLKRMGKEGEWGDHIALIAITEVIGRTVTVLNSSETATHLHPHKSLEPEEMAINENVYLGYVGGSHYVSLRPKDWQTTWSINAKMRRIKRLLSIEERHSIGVIITDEKTTNQTGCNSGEMKYDLTKPNHDEVLNSLNTNIFCVDPVSRIPVMHLSYIIQELLKDNYFFMYSRPYQGSVTHSWLISRNNGTIRLNLSVGLSNFTQSLSKFTYTDDYATSDLEFLGVYLETEGKYTILNDTMVSSIFGKEEENLTYTIDTDETHPGYLRLRSEKPVYMSGTGSPPDYLTRKVHNKYYIEKLPFIIKSQDEYEFVPALICSEWPFEAFRWVNRERASGWPSRELITKITKKGCFLAHRAHPNSFDKELEFQFVFTDAEEMLAAELTGDMKYCFFVFQTLVRFQTRKIHITLPPYFLVTTFLYACESVPGEIWRNSCGGCVLYMTELLLHWLRAKFLPHYFIPKNNLIDTWKSIKLRLICEELESLRLFPCMVLHFVGEAHGLTHSWLIDSVMASSKRFKTDGDRQWTVENVFNPTTFALVKSYLKKKRNYKFVLNELNNAFEKNLVWTGECLVFKEFLDHFLLTVDNEKTRELFMIFVNREIGISRAKQGIGEISLEEFLQKRYTGKYGNRRFVYEDTDSEIWEDIDVFIESLALDYHEYEETSAIVLCLIEKSKNDIKRGVVEVGEIDDVEVRIQIEKSNERKRQENFKRRRNYYLLLFICYCHLGKKEKIKEFLYELEEAVNEMPTKPSLSVLSNIFKAMNFGSKALEIRERVKTVRNSDTYEDSGYIDLLNTILGTKSRLCICGKGYSRNSAQDMFEVD